tara:strand:- start:3833 stop:5803 length:1971 start_codon:yes stop_codon:yes gene_type:complete
VSKRRARHETDWIAAISERSEKTESEVIEVLGRHRIRATQALPKPRRLLLRKIRFAGERIGVANEGPFEFEWELGMPGVWCVTSENNLVGKSTVLEVAMWALRGVPRGLQEDVRGWLREVEVSFDVDAVTHCVSFSLSSGKPVGRLVRHTPKTRRNVAVFDSAESFERAMGDFMLQTLGLEPLPSWQKFPRAEDGRQVWHGWRAFSGALFVPDSSHEALLGELAIAGLPGRLLQMFVGMPWAQTVALAKGTQKLVAQMDRNQKRRAQEDALAREQDLEQLQLEAEGARARLKALPDTGTEIREMDLAVSSLRTIAVQCAEVERRIRESEKALAEAEDSRLADKKSLVDLREGRLAALFFHGLDPSHCPRCDESISQERRQGEQDTGQCSICTRPLGAIDLEASEDVLQEAEDRAKGSKKAVVEARAALNRHHDDLEKRERRQELFRNQLEELRSKRSRASERWAAELEVAKLEGRLAERESRVTQAEDSGSHESDLAILQAVVSESERLGKAASEEFLAHLDAEILRLATKFGIHALEKVRLDRGARLMIWKGGKKTSFSKVTKGERLRLRVATIIAMLRVSEELGVGRHPFLLFIDSPGAEEVKDVDAACLVGELQRLAGELRLQVIVATARPDLLPAEIPDARIRRSGEDGRMW